MNTEFSDWTPQELVESDTVGAGTAASLHGLLDAPGDAPWIGAPLPPLWHWVAFVPRVPQRELGEDGHPRLGSFMPPVRLRRRMFAGGRLRFGEPLIVGEPLIRRSAVTSVTNKEGRSGELCFVTVTHEVLGESGGSVREEQDIVYRSEASVGATSPVDREPGGGGTDSLGDWPLSLRMEVSPTLLFRFSALTYNAHRIHYDRPYATEVEGYPGLVVHGPLQAVALAELCRRELDDQIVRSFTFQAKRPAFDDGPMTFCGRAEGDEVALRALDAMGAVTMVAKAETS